jgi:glucan endo-1,3-alpha-glucosidase
VDIVEVISWNDYGESHYVGPIEGAQPNSQAWVNGFPHTRAPPLAHAGRRAESLAAFLDMGQFYIQAFKNGRYSAITRDQVYISSRPHTHDAVAASDGLGRPLGWDWVRAVPPIRVCLAVADTVRAQTVDNLWAVVFATAPGSLALTSGANTTTFAVAAGVNKFAMPSLPGAIRATLTRAGAVVVDVNPGDAFSYTTAPSSYNYNVFIASGST